MAVIAAALLACATSVHPITMEKVISGESGGNPYAINVNRYSGRQPHPASAQEAVEAASRFIAEGFSVDLGMTQINSRNLDSLGYTIADAFDSCKNIAGGGTILTSFYRSAAERYGDGQAALRAAISAYNTGSFYKGFSNGYVARIIGIPEISTVAVTRSVMQEPIHKPPPPDPYYASTQIYTQAAFNVPIQ